MPQGPFGGPRPLARCSLGIQVTASQENRFTEDMLSEDIQQIDNRFSRARREGKSGAVVTVENATVIGRGRAAKFRIGPSTLNREQLDESLNIFEEHYGDRITTVAITLAD